MPVMRHKVDYTVLMVCIILETKKTLINAVPGSFTNGMLLIMGFLKHQNMVTIVTFQYIAIVSVNSPTLQPLLLPLLRLKGENK